MEEVHESTTVGGFVLDVLEFQQSGKTNTFRTAMRTQMAVSRSSQIDGRRDELADWLAQPPVPTEDPLRWWLANRDLYPCLSCMAIDVHATPATAVDVERSFSSGRILIGHLRNRLRAGSIRALMCFGDWCRLQLVSDADLAAAIRSSGAAAATEKKKGSKSKEKEKDI